jgi:hypothetical protein
MSASMPLLGFILNGCLLEASYQPVGSADRHLSENIRKKGKVYARHSPTHT